MARPEGLIRAFGPHPAGALRASVAREARLGWTAAALPRRRYGVSLDARFANCDNSDASVQTLSELLALMAGLAREAVGRMQ